MDDKDKAQKPHQDLGEVGEHGAAGELGSNAAGADRTAAAQESLSAESGFRLVPRTAAELREVSPEEDLTASLIRVGFGEEESKKMAKSAVEEIARRKE